MTEFITGFDGRTDSLETCGVPEEEYRIQPFGMIIFGGGGDLSQRKLIPTVYGIFDNGELPEAFGVLGVGMPAMSDEEYRALMKDAVQRSGEVSFSEEQWTLFAPHLHYVSGGFDEESAYHALQKKLEGFGDECSRNVIYYLAVPPSITPVIVEKLRDLGMCGVGAGAKVVVEKPFGRDRKSAVHLNGILRSAFEENQIYRIDHYLGKETVQNIIFMRFSNTIFERLWNSQYIDNVQITVAEDMGVEHRGSFYEQAGVVRDIVQNHLMQIVALVAMEPPVGFEADYIRDEKVKVFRSIRPMRDEEVDRLTVRGQYGPGVAGGERVPGYRQEESVDGNSNVPTYMAARLAVANWRWAGVPFYVRAGKRLARRVTEVCLQFKQPPLRLFGMACDPLEPNILVLTIQPDERILLRFGVKYPRAANKIYPVNVDFRYRDVFKEKMQPPYGRLLVDCMKGDLTLFVRQDGVEAMWDCVDPVIERWEARREPDLPNYDAGTWGPREALDIPGRDDRRWITE
jgi:glucose-6-phosphate 1-dehydrogenase